MSSQEVDFARDIQPIFAKNCVACHGPDDAEGGLRLTEKDSAFGELDSGELGIVPGDADASELVRRITAEDESERMPPEGKPLSEAQVQLIRKWIDDGANWSKHWAFEPPVAHEPPATENNAWAKNPIDQFILAGLEKKGLSPNPRAVDTELIRRAYYDLTGLPPTPDEVAQYAADNDPNKFARLVDRLLDSEHFGERWGRHWLDLVRFAETNSFERDGNKPEAWRYRDYVIRSFNQDKPYDQFIIEQLAGDELPNPSADAIIATGFYRLGLWDDEPADPLLAKFDTLDDIVTTTGQVFLGLTVNCARCHDHKIDPITQADYYSMVSFFHNITPMANGGDRILRPIFPEENSQEKYENAVAERQKKIDDVQTAIARLEGKFAAAAQNEGADAANVQDIRDLRFRFYRDTWDKLPVFDEIKHEDEGELPSGKFDLDPATRPDFFGFVFEGSLVVPNQGTYHFTLDSDDGTRLLINGKTVLEHDGIHGTGSPKTATVELEAGSVPVRLEYFQKQFGKGLSVTWSGEGFTRSLSASNSDANQSEPDMDVRKLIAENGAELLGEETVQEYKGLLERAERLKKDRVAVEQALCVTEYGSAPPETFVLTRGSPQAPGDKVEPRFPELFGDPAPEMPTMPDDARTTGRRMVLAKWIASPENMQTSRVMVNRLWQHLFGRGIVESSNNFGILGVPPSHPDLLNWLAVQFANDHQWRIKSMIRLIMNSSTYQMSSRANEVALQKDVMNQWFWRQNMRRLSAEEVRDSILAVNGRLNTQMHGPSVYPDIPPEVLAGQSRPGQGWGKSSPEQQARRSIYVFVKRSLLVPEIINFDFAETDQTCPVRFETTQPTQALTMLNGKFINDQASVLADRLIREAGPELKSQVAMALRLVSQRAPADEEVNEGVQLIKRLQDEDGVTPDAALKTFCLMALNLNEFIYLD
ncbi:MAG: DUF1549 domain-containing protein [Pirellulaceae bacterium]